MHVQALRAEILCVHVMFWHMHVLSFARIRFLRIMSLELGASIWLECSSGIIKDLTHRLLCTFYMPSIYTVYLFIYFQILKSKRF